ncbi:MAG: 2-oxoacid:acceptor oxidoreductase family protein [Thermodesulfovibrionales bacterium]
MEKGIIIAGFGGQGILFLGKTIAHAAMLSGKEVTWFPSYGAEMRGGTANCTVIISDELIGSPVAGNVDILIVFNEASLKKFSHRLKKDGLLFYDSSVIKETINSGIATPATRIAAEDGNPRGANMVMLGAFIAKAGILNEEDIFKTLEEIIPSSRNKLVEINKRLIRRGIEYFENKKSHSK